MSVSVGILIFFNIIIMSFRLILRKSGNRKLLRLLTISWMLCLLLTAALSALIASETYVAPDRIYIGYWYDALTGVKIQNEYDLVGGEGTNPIAQFFLVGFLLAIVEFFTGAAVALAKDKANKSHTLLSKVFIFIGYFMLFSWINCLSFGIYSIYKILKRE